MTTESFTWYGIAFELDSSKLIVLKLFKERKNSVNKEIRIKD